MWTVILLTQMFPPVDVAKEGWWMTEQGALSRRGVQTQAGENLTDMVLVWRDTVDGGAVGAPLIGDVDGDGRNEVVVNKFYGIHILDVPSRTIEWRFMKPESTIWNCFFIYPALGDVDGDGVVEIVAMDDSHRVWILDAARQAVEGMIPLPTYNTSDTRCPRTPMYIVDLENDGVHGLVVGGMAYLAPSNLYYIIPCASSAGGMCQDSLVWAKFRLSTLYPFFWIPFGDVDGDDSLEFALWSVVDTTLVMYNAGGDTLWFRHPPQGDSRALPFAIVDLDGDGGKEVLATGTGGMLIQYTYVLDGATGALKWQFIQCGGWLQAFADINGDGQLEIVCGVGFRTARALTARGALLWETTLPASSGAGFVAQGPIVGDFTPSPGLESLFCTETDGLFLVSSRGKVIWADSTLETSTCRIAAGDVDGDGFSEIVVNSSYGGTYIFDRPTDVEEAHPEPIRNDHGFRLIPGGFALARPSSVAVFDLTGRKVFSGRIQSLRLAPGGYLVNLPETTLKIVVGK